jgi:hypothetical protein
MRFSKADAARIEEMPDRPFNDSAENKARRILEELPHLTAKDIAQVAAGLVADAEAATQMAEIIKEAALQILHGRAEQGDEHARELFYKLYEAVGPSVYDENEHIDLRARAQ